MNLQITYEAVRGFSQILGYLNAVYEKKLPMSVIQKSSTIMKWLLRPRSNNLHRYGTINEKMFENLDDNIVWIDMEMTGLDIETCYILEVACLVTDAKLNIVSPDFKVVINQSNEILNNMNEWCKKQHGKTGLTDACQNSKVTLEIAEKDLLKFLKNHVPEGKCPMAGNSVYMDRMFLAKYMPTVHKYLHYRIIDTSSIKELTRRWNPEVYQNAPKKVFTHRAVDDIKESLAELQFYKNNIFRTTDCN